MRTGPREAMSKATNLQASAFPSIAKRVLLEAIERLEHFCRCDFCKAGECDDDGGDQDHSEECPLWGFDMTDDLERLKAWAKEP